MVTAAPAGLGDGGSGGDGGPAPLVATVVSAASHGHRRRRRSRRRRCATVVPVVPAVTGDAAAVGIGDRRPRRRRRRRRPKAVLAVTAVTARSVGQRRRRRRRGRRHRRHPTSLPALGGAGGNAGRVRQPRHGRPLWDGGRRYRVRPRSLPPLSTTGSWLTDSDGQVVMLHGPNEVYKVAPYDHPPAGSTTRTRSSWLTMASTLCGWASSGRQWSPRPASSTTDYLHSIDRHRADTGRPRHLQHLDMHQDAYSSDFGGEGAPAWAVQTTGCPTRELGFPFNEFFNPAGAARLGCVLVERPMSDGAGGRSVWRTVTRRCWNTLRTTSKATPTCSASRS